MVKYINSDNVLRIQLSLFQMMIVVNINLSFCKMLKKWTLVEQPLIVVTLYLIIRMEALLISVKIQLSISC